MEGWGDWDERKEGLEDREVRDDIDTRVESRGGLNGGEERKVACHVISKYVTAKKKGTARQKINK